MKILHTADWHLGLNLYQSSLEADHQLFLDWFLETCVPACKPDVLLIAGDIFDKANPPAYARHQYFTFLSRLLTAGIRQVIITAGNHDSPAMLEAPRELLQKLNIYIQGTPPQDGQDLFIPIRNRADEAPAVMVAPIPYLRDQDLRLSGQEESLENVSQAVREGIQAYYQRVAIAGEPYRNRGIPLIVMGHLFAQGAMVSDSEKSVQIGNLGAVAADCFPREAFSYVALGHIHKPQPVQQATHIWYSGSPIPLSFSERSQQKSLQLLTITGDSLQRESIAVPSFRDLLRISGNLESVAQRLQNLQHDKPLPAYLELSIEEETYHPTKGRDIADLINKMNQTRKEVFQILHYQYRFTRDQPPLSAMTAETELESLQVSDVFTKKLNTSSLSEEDRNACLIAFHQILESLEN